MPVEHKALSVDVFPNSNRCLAKVDFSSMKSLYVEAELLVKKEFGFRICDASRPWILLAFFILNLLLSPLVSSMGSCFHGSWRNDKNNPSNQGYFRDTFTFELPCWFFFAKKVFILCVFSSFVYFVRVRAQI